MPDSYVGSRCQAAVHDFVRDTGVALYDEFGAKFYFWLPGETWAVFSGDELAEPPGPGHEQAARALYERFSRPARGELILVERTGGHVTLALLLEPRPGVPLLATAIFADREEELLAKLARLFLQKMQLAQQLHRYQYDLNICAAKIGDDFEELTFLRTLAEHLDVADVSLGMWEVAQLVLPLLGPLVQADALVLVPIGKTWDHPHGVLDKPAVWVGSKKVGERVCWDLIERFGQTATRFPVIENHLQDSADAAEFSGIREFVLTPLVKSEATLGWLVAVNRSHRHLPAGDGAHWVLSDQEFGSIEASLLESVASMLATHARNVELFREKEALLVGVVRAMVSAVEAKDPHTCGHSERVALIAQFLARELGLSDTECERLYLTGLLHDVGKIGIRDAVLTKPGKLDPEEYAEIKRHPDQGWAILRDLDQLNYVFPGVRHHHEWYNGRGYPDGLVGEGIPFIARVLAVADAYDAMVSDRPYRKGMPHDMVLDIIRDGAGTQWDPRVVEIFLRTAARIQAIWCEYEQASPRKQAADGLRPNDASPSKEDCAPLGHVPECGTPLFSAGSGLSASADDLLQAAASGSPA